MPITLHFNYSDKSLPAKLADSMATPLRWASGKGKIDLRANTVTKVPLSEAKLASAAYRIIGVVLVIFGIVTIVPIPTTLLFKAAIARWDTSAQKACNIYAEFKEPQKHSNTDQKTLRPSREPEIIPVEEKKPESEPNKRKNSDEKEPVNSPERIQYNAAEEQKAEPEQKTDASVVDPKTLEDKEDHQFRKDLSARKKSDNPLSSPANNLINTYTNIAATSNLLDKDPPSKPIIKTAEHNNRKATNPSSPSNLGELAAGGYSTIGFFKPYQEGTHILEQLSSSWEGREVPIKVASVFDGHGGQVCARFLKDHFNPTFLAALALSQKLISLKTNTQDLWDYNLRDIAIRNALKYTFVILHNEFKKTNNQSGSTACVNLIIDNKIYTANTGDSRAVYRRSKEAEIQQLSWDHKPHACQKGVNKRGEIIEGNRVNDLTIASAIGDYNIQGITPPPRIMIAEAPTGAGYLIIASDRLWDVCTCSQAFNLLDLFLDENPELSCSELARKMAYRALANCSSDSIRIFDSISILIVRV